MGRQKGTLGRQVFITDEFQMWLDSAPYWAEKNQQFPFTVLSCVVLIGKYSSPPQRLILVMGYVVLSFRELLTLQVNHAPCFPMFWLLVNLSGWGLYYLSIISIHHGLPRWLSGKASTCQWRRCRFDPWVRKILLQEEMAPHSSTLAREIPWTEKPGGLQSMGLKKSQMWLSN